MEIAVGRIKTDVNSRSAQRSSLPLLGLCCLVYVAVIAALAPADFVVVLMHYTIVLLVSLPVILAITVGTAAYAESPHDPLKAARRLLGNVRVGSAVSIMIATLLGIVAYTTFKSNMPRLAPFDVDPFLADLDEFLHGEGPWLLLRELPQAIASVWFGQLFGILLYVALWNGGARKERYLWALALATLIVGTLLATALSSVGPIFYDRFYGGDRFAHLTEALQLNGPVLAKHFATYLVLTHENGTAGFGSGISAMPSMHIAVATLNAFFLTGTRQRALAIAGWLFLAIIQFGAIYSGWHYAVDGYVSMVVVALIWWLTGLCFFGSFAGKQQQRSSVNSGAVARPVQGGVRGPQ